MKIPTSEKSPQSWVEEYQHTTEHSKYEELHKNRESYTNSEFSVVDIDVSAAPSS